MLCVSWRRPIRAASRCTWNWAWRSKKTAPEEAIAAFEHAATLVPHATGPDSPQAQIAEIALARGDKARAIKASTRSPVSTTRTSRRRASWPRWSTRRRRRRCCEPRSCARWRSTPSILPRTPRWDGWRCPPATRRKRSGCSRSRWPPGPSTRRARTPTWLKDSFAAGRPDEARRQALAALEIAPTYIRAQDLLLKLAGGR